MLMPGYSWNVVNRRVFLDENNTVEYKTYSEKITDYEYLKVIFCDMSLLRKCADNQRFIKIRFSLNIKKYP